ETMGGSVVLIKGGRSFGFERITDALQWQQHETQLEIDLAALGHNLNVYRSMLKPGTKLMVMLKAFGYGSTDAELGRWLQHHGADHIAVAYTDEGVTLRQGGVTLPIMVMNPEPGTFAQLTDFNLEPELFSNDIAIAFAKFLNEVAIPQYPVHIKLDTGMHRLGFLDEDIPALCALLKNDAGLRVVSVFTHLVASDDPDQDTYTQEQFEKFLAGCDMLQQALGYSFIRHAANTAAISRHPHMHLDMVRLGIGLFGFSNTPSGQPPLLPATRLFTTVAQVKKVAAGNTVGYGRRALLQRDSLIATVRIGYADGYRRQLSNGVGQMWVGNTLAPVAGNVCMDMTMLDVTAIEGVRPGDRVEVFGTHITAEDLAKKCKTIPYEILTGISRRVQRILIDA
ncbi:MAG TPA: alanine racemase, partial [Phnomibacter sp.]|nr:alanine racemase [Phnomibacter sp.]